MKKTWVSLLILLGFVFVAIAVYYWVTPAGSLPSWVPGHEAGSAHKHLKHGLAAIILALGCWVLAWFSTGKKTTASTQPPAAPSAPAE